MRIYAAHVTRRQVNLDAESIQVSDAYSSCFRCFCLVDASAIFMGRAVRAVSRLRDSRHRRPPHHNSREIELRRLWQKGRGGGEAFAFAKLVPLAERKNININSKINSRR